MLDGIVEEAVAAGEITADEAAEIEDAIEAAAVEVTEEEATEIEEAIEAAAVEVTEEESVAALVEAPEEDESPDA